ATAGAVMRAIGHAGEHPEGRFFPDTYRFADGTTDRELYRLAFDTMTRELAAAWQARHMELPLANADEALVLASIVEKETALASERPLIAGVFVTRLRKGMRLQTDPTVIYGLGSRYDGDIRRRDLLADTPYNTYTRAGLPPTPIALPGREALLAAVQPDESGALYFVATGKGDGSHVFSKTLAEHNAAVARYLARLRARAATTAK
ncbi:MAG: endolytic transglycosylase MltG, partial [Steroidobacteraceae bacterium]